MILRKTRESLNTSNYLGNFFYGNFWKRGNKSQFTIWMKASGKNGWMVEIPI
jgi:hypothetical protein